MSDSAAHLVDEVLPKVPVRQWVCSRPWQLRYAMGYDAKLCSAVLAAFVHALRRSLRRRAKLEFNLHEEVAGPYGETGSRRTARPIWSPGSSTRRRSKELSLSTTDGACWRIRGDWTCTNFVGTARSRHECAVAAVWGRAVQAAKSSSSCPGGVGLGAPFQAAAQIVHVCIVYSRARMPSLSRSITTLALFASLAPGCRRDDGAEAKGDDARGPANSAPCGRVAYLHANDDALRVRVVPVAGGASRRVTMDANDNWEQLLTASPDGRWLLLGTGSARDVHGGTLGLVDLHSWSRTVQPVATYDFELRHPAWAPDSSFFIFAGPKGDERGYAGLFRFDMRTQTSERLATGTASFWPAVSPDGRDVVFIAIRDDGHADLDVLRLGDDAPPWGLTHDPAFESAPTWSPDGNTIAFASERGPKRRLDVFLINRDGGELRPLIRDARGRGDVNLTGMWGPELAFSPDGSQLAFTEERSMGPGAGITTEIVIAAVATGEVVTRVDAAKADDPSWSPSGDALVFTQILGEERSALVRVRADGSKLEVITQGRFSVSRPIWLRDGSCRSETRQRHDPN